MRVFCCTFYPFWSIFLAYANLFWHILFYNLSNCQLYVFEAECFKDRTDVQCLHRWQKVLNPELVKGPWSKEVVSTFHLFFVLILSQHVEVVLFLCYFLPNTKPIILNLPSKLLWACDLEFNPCCTHYFDVTLDYINFQVRYVLWTYLSNPNM